MSLCELDQQQCATALRGARTLDDFIANLGLEGEDTFKVVRAIVLKWGAERFAAAVDTPGFLYDIADEMYSDLAVVLRKRAAVYASIDEYAGARK